MPLDAPYLSAIKSFEGFAPTASWDYKQYSNGYGTKAAFPGETIDRDTAEQRFNTELGKAASYVDRSFPRLPDNKRAALASLTYNAGPGWINSGLGAAVRQGDWQDASNRFLQYNKADGKFNQGLADRRAKESAWLNDETPTPMAAAFKGNQPMADDQQPQPSLSSRFIAGGPGALFGAPQQDYSWNRALTRGFASLRDDPSAYVQASKPQEDYSLVQGADGTMFRLNKKTGQVTPHSDGGKIVDGPEDMFGNKSKLIWRNGKFYPLQVEGGNAAAAGNSPFLAKGVSEVNHELSGDDYLKQFAPEIQAYVKSKSEGQIPATANARKGFTQAADTVAAKYGQDMGVPMDLASVAERRKFGQELAATANPAMYGGQRTATKTLIPHLHTLLDNVDALGNTNGGGSEFLSGIFNRPSGSIFNSTERAGGLKALNDTASAYTGERMKLLSGRAGSAEERQQMVNQLFGGQGSDAALRKAIRNEVEIISGRVKPLEDKLESSTMPQATKDRHKIIGPEEERLISEILRRTAPDYVRPTKGATPAAGPAPKGRVLKVVPAAEQDPNSL